jgi:hypothetical protein
MKKRKLFISALLHHSRGRLGGSARLLKGQFVRCNVRANKKGQDTERQERERERELEIGRKRKRERESKGAMGAGVVCRSRKTTNFCGGVAVLVVGTTATDEHLLNERKTPFLSLSLSPLSPSPSPS